MGRWHVQGILQNASALASRPRPSSHQPARLFRATAVRTGSLRPVVVIGGGVGGLTLARVLQHRGHKDVVVYDSDKTAEARAQGGTLDLRGDSGQWALAQAGLESEFRAMSRPEGQDLRLLDHTGRVHLEEVDTPPDLMDRPEIDRPVLRRLLLDSLHPGTIQWDHTLASIKEEEGVLRMRFMSGRVVDVPEGAVVVGADGAWSRVRPLVTNAKPFYTGVSFIDLLIPEANTRNAAATAVVGRGSLFALGGCKSIVAQRNGDGTVRVYAAFKVDNPGRGQTIRFVDGTTLSLDTPVSSDKTKMQRTSMIASQYDGWCPTLRDLILTCDEDSIVLRPIYTMTTGLTWPPARKAGKRIVTLLGDAAHLMSPYAGAGANLAMQDGAALGIALSSPAAAGAGGGEVVAAFEAGMFARAEVEATISARNMEMSMAKDGAVKMAAVMKQMMTMAAASTKP